MKELMFEAGPREGGVKRVRPIEIVGGVAVILGVSEVGPNLVSALTFHLLHLHHLLRYYFDFYHFHLSLSLCPKRK